MSILSYEPFLGLPQYSDDDKNHGTGERNKWAQLGQIVCPENVFYVSPSYTAGNLPHIANATTRRHFDTIQSAIDEAEDVLGYGTGERGVIVVYPGDYRESITVTKNISLVGACGHVGSGVNYAGMPRLLGEDSTDPVITFDPVDSQQCGLSVSGFQIRNDYDTDGTTENNYYLFRSSKPDTYPSYNMKVVFSNCHMRMQHLGTGNRWLAAFRVEAGIDLYMHDCVVIDEPHDGDAFMRQIWNVLGDEANNKRAGLFLKRVEVRHPRHDLASGTTDATITATNKAMVSAYDCAFSRANFEEVIHFGPFGTNNVVGLLDYMNAAEHKNALGVYVANA